jgi:hypothetical protein
MNDKRDESSGSDNNNSEWYGLSRRQFVAQLGVASITGLATWHVLADSPTTAAIGVNETDPESTKDDKDHTEGNSNMPLIRIDAFEGRSEPEIKTLLDAAHRAVVKALHANERDRYQIYESHSKSRFIMQDTGLGFARTDKALIITVVSKGRPEVLKRRLYKEFIDELGRSAAIAPTDIMICIVENGAADWTFGNGDPQFLTGDLA